MDIFLIIGIITGLGAIIVGMTLKGASIGVLINPEAAIIILVGTTAAVMNSFPKKEFLKIPSLLGVLFKEKKRDNPAETIEKIVQMSQVTRKNGLLSLEETLKDIDDKFMKKGLEMVVDGVDPENVRDILEIEIEGLEERHRLGASILTTAGASSPTLGVLGAVIGLIGALGNLADTQKLGESIASAFVATLYGIFFGYVIFHPFASRLKRKSSEEVSTMNIVLEGILCIQLGENPKNIENKLVCMLEPKDRLKFQQINAEENSNEKEKGTL
ncbi:flagellar motor stator protein MotA [Clostridium estertheticum]|uniref:flagellar motor stator protein MotA n=1 Tax=Clostridium estertheticum TaxID=238834 RepID=UPI001C7D3EB3|nr:flagellar motor stator protein MotA [Clostridium estertheticum]MBX4259480.1 flagellar motor stator protein MotA [Clostridium estertheticum]WLC70777.1 flagellar motor stator protein MotA [Clostridium estertheticum]